MRPEDRQAADWHEEKTYESLITYGLNAIKFVLYFNGGAILGMLTFLGEHFDKAKNLECSIIWFVAGTITGGFCCVTAYLTQIALFNERGQKVSWAENHKTWLWASMVLIILGIVAFSGGALLAASGLSEVASIEVKK